MKEHSVKYQSQNLTSLRFRLAISFAVIGILASAIAMFLSYLQSRNNLFEEKQDKLTAIVANAALQIDGDQHALLNTPADMESDAYRELQQKGFAIAATDTEILYVYTMRKDETGSIYFVLDAGHEPGGTPQEYEPSEIGLAYESPTDLLSDNFETMSDPIVEPDFYTDEFGTYLTAYAPFYRSDGSLEGVVGIDILARNVVAQQVEFIETFLLLFVLSAAGSAVLGWLAGSFIARPVLRLSEAVMNIRDVSEKLEIKTGIREVNLLADNFNKMFDALRANEERLQEQTARLDSQNEQLQNSLRQLNKRANQFKAISQAVRGTISNESLDTLLPRLTTLISEQFGFYHAGIFLLDEDASLQSCAPRTAKAASGCSHADTSSRSGRPAWWATSQRSARPASPWTWEMMRFTLTTPTSRTPAPKWRSPCGSRTRSSAYWMSKASCPTPFREMMSKSCPRSRTRWRSPSKIHAHTKRCRNCLKKRRGHPRHICKTPGRLCNPRR